MKYSILSLLLFCIVNAALSQKKDFVTANGTRFFINGKSYHYIGANYWYGGLLANDDAGKKRVKKELDFLVSKGVNNLRVMAGAEGTGKINGLTRVEPALQPTAGNFNEQLLTGLDFLLSEMAKRKMKAVIFLSNNWEWSGGFPQYLNWNGRIPDSVLQRKWSWDENRDMVAGFYGCEPCIQQYTKQLKLIINRTNSVTGKKYTDEPAVMAWEIANEPRPMRPAAVDDYKIWISNTAAMIRKIDNNHLITIGSEGYIGSETMEVFEAVHADKNVDYATIHIWPKNWQWFKDTAISKDMAQVKANTNAYIDKHIPVVKRLNKPLVIEEFGLPRNGQSFTPGTSTSLRNMYYEMIFQKLWKSITEKGVIAGANFWSFSGSGRPSGKQLLWVKGDDLLGDPPVEEQGLNSVFDNDTDTWELIESFTKKINTAVKIK